MSPGQATDGSLAAGLAGGAVVLLAVLLVLTGLLIRRYRSECHQLRARNRQLSIENDRWHEDFAAQSGELAVLRYGSCGYRAGAGEPAGAAGTGGPGRVIRAVGAHAEAS